MIRRRSLDALMRTSIFGQLVAFSFRSLPLRSKFLALSVRLEGGQMYSLTLRRVLRKYFGVNAGNYTYGSLLQPGLADVRTDIGRYVSIGSGVRRIGAAHPLSKVSMHPFWYNATFGFVDESFDVSRSACSIGHDSWIGADSIILPGCRSIGVGAVIGAGSVVTADVPDFGIVAGSPARLLRFRFGVKDIQRIMDSQYWLLEPLEAKQFLDSFDVDSQDS